MDAEPKIYNMRVTIEITDIKEIEVLMKLLQKFNLENVKVVEGIEKQEDKEEGPTLIKGDKSIDPGGLFGIWEEKPRKIEEIRNKSWGRNWN